MIYSFYTDSSGMYYDPPSKHLFIEANSKEEALIKFDEFIDKEEKRLLEIDKPELTTRDKDPWSSSLFDSFVNLKESDRIKQIKSTIKEHIGPVQSTGRDEIIDSPTYWQL